MLRKSKYKTISGQIAEISQVTAKGAIGWVDGIPTAWTSTGKALGREDHGLVTWSALTLPRMRLAEPMRDAPEDGDTVYLFEPGTADAQAIVWTGSKTQSELLQAGQIHMLESSAQEYCDFWAKYIGKIEKQSGITPK